MHGVTANVRRYRLGSKDVVEAGGEIHVFTVREFKEQLILLAATSRELVADLRGVTYIDSAGIEALIGTCTRMSGRGQPFAVLVAPHSQVEDVLRVVSFDSLAMVTSDPSEAGLET